VLSISGFQPLGLRVRPKPFDNANWLFELKYDGFRALACVRYGKCQLVSRNGNAFASFGELCTVMASDLSHVSTAVLDGEIVCLDERGRPQFEDLLFRRGDAYFIAFDLMNRNGEDLRRFPLIERKQALRILFAGTLI
jgi:bifunctional non-homologous end joining protein LigD